MKIVPINYPDDLMNMIRESEHGENYVGIEKMSITYIQPDDMMSDETQEITLTTEYQCSVGIDDALKKDNIYVNIKTGDSGHWSINDGDEFKTLIDDFLSRFWKGVEHIKSNKDKDVKD